MLFKNISLLFVVFVATSCLFDTVRANGDDASALVNLTEENFEQLVMNRETKQVIDKPWFVKFYAPWCGHCKQLAPIWEEFSNTHGQELNVGHVDCTENKALCKEFEVKGYPTLLYFSGDQMTKFKGKRNLESLTEFAQSQ
mmetsp:Transcript_10564/g.7445  ORF Transcript_10564/g.7445 Transcript_10564/m.7445 type:complete len:141 (-) Transcript_10564:80-502(-)